MASKPFVSGWAMIVIGCCGNGPWWASLLIGGLGVMVVWSAKEEEGSA